MDQSYLYSTRIQETFDEDQTEILHIFKEEIYNLAVLIGIDGAGLPCKYRFTTAPDKILDREIARYLLQRQIEILQEIKDVTE